MTRFVTRISIRLASACSGSSRAPVSSARLVRASRRRSCSRKLRWTPPATKPKRSWVEPEQLPALLDVADGWLRPVLAALAGAGLRVGEAVALDWSDVNLATGTLVVRESKTDAGSGRQVDLLAGALDELREWKARSPMPRPEDPVFVSRARKGVHRRQTKRNVEARLKATVRRATERLAVAGIEPISDAVSPHSLRRTYASLRAALRDDPVYIAEQIGHTDARFSLSVYAKAAKRRERLSGDYLAAFDRALDWALMGTSATNQLAKQANQRHSEDPGTPAAKRVNSPAPGA